MNQSRIISFALIALGLFCAVILGTYVAEEKYLNIGILCTAITILILCLTLKARIWMLIPLFGSFSGSVAVLPGNLKLGEIAILIAFGTTVSLAAMKFIPRLPRWNGYDGLLFLNLIYLATVFARNPVGVLMLQSDIIGGRPYFEIAIALLAYLALQHVTLTAKQATIIPILAGFGVVANTC